MLLESGLKRGQDKQFSREQKCTSRVFQGRSEQNGVFKVCMSKMYCDEDVGRTMATLPPTKKFCCLYVSLSRTSWSVGRDTIIPAASEPRTAGNSLNL